MVGSAFDLNLSLLFLLWQQTFPEANKSLYRSFSH